MKLWTFNPVDSCFFRGANPFNAGEGGFLDSQFPPTAQTMTGVIRATIAADNNVNWDQFHRGEQEDIANLVGRNGDDAGALRFGGPYIIREKQRLFPLPMHLLYSDQHRKWAWLEPSEEALLTDQGDLQLPTLCSNASEGSKPLANAWLDQTNFTSVLQGGAPTDYYEQKDFFKAESRTGIGRDNATRTVEEGQLYFTRHIRLINDVNLAMSVDGADAMQVERMVRLGGEGRAAQLSIDSTLPTVPERKEINGKGIIILLTHGDFKGKSLPPLPKGLNITSACIGKAVREGGWDYKENQPKPLKSLVPAGSVYFIEGNTALLGSHIGDRTAFGYGEIAIGMMQKGVR